MTAKRCTVAYALPDAQWLWELELHGAATVGDAIDAARERAVATLGSPVPPVDWEHASVGVFGVVCGRERLLADGDRVEIYRPLAVDPRAARRARSAGPARGRRSSG
ncbi:MAG: RnfH family protein [Steroidobacteraceae bacterium]|nr:RnfH family protein [Steroidobacteraceae bacterium]